MSDVPQLDTPGRIADKLGEPLTRSQYVLRTRRHIRESARAGTLRLYDHAAVELIRAELAAIDAAKVKQEPATA